MRLFNRFFDGELHLTRIEAISDAVFAIIVTLLVLELKVPALKDHASVGELARQRSSPMPKTHMRFSRD
jgi:TMEM175 potassium channel family protein